jgi:hypothetical protein
MDLVKRCVALPRCVALLLVLASTTTALAPTRRQLVLGGGCATLVTPSIAGANIAGGSSNSLNLRINDKITAPEAKTQPDVVLDNAVLEPLSKYANDFGDIGAAFAEEDGGGAAQIQKFFAPGGSYERLARSVQGVTGDDTMPKGVRKAGKAFLDATSMTRASYNVGDFDKAFAQYGTSLTILVGFLGRVGVVADAPVAPREAAAPVTRRTYLPGPFQTL